MKKLLVFLLLPIMAFSQDLYLDHSYINPAGFTVGDTITVKFNTIDNQSGNLTQTLWQFDYQYNNKLLQKIDHTWKITGANQNPNAQVTLNHWDGYKFNGSTSVNENDLTGQYNHWLNPNGVNTYPTNADWSVERITVQDASALTFAETILEVRFVVKDNANTNYDYSAVTHLNWMRAYDNSTSSTHSVHAMTQEIDLGSVSGTALNNVIFNLKTNAVDVEGINPQDYWIEITKKADLDAYWDNQENGDGSMQWPQPVASGQFDNASKQFTTGDLLNDVEYMVHAHVINTPAWLDNVVTVTDAYKIFQFAAGSDINGGQISWEYYVQDILGEVTNDQKVDFDDSYEVLAHINGVTTSANITSVSNGAFNLSGNAAGFGVGTDVNGTMRASWTQIVKPSSSATVFNIVHQLRGDVDFSHSFEPVAAGSKAETNVNTSAKTTQGAILMNRAVEESPVEIFSRLENNQVILDFNIGAQELAGAQLIITFDDSKLSFDKATFDTGNTMTNFATQRGNRIYLGSLDVNGESSIKTGTPYKLSFTPKTSITNTIGLVSYQLIEGVKIDGTKVKFNIQ